ncbi:hypothetical protein F4814DRAFT_196415 [Daldinia grandis]|nr:hypothetical protein F4814DRAFT_196415 [Daldinia grandis]
MAPTAEALEKDLRDGVRALVAERGWDQVTVNNVRQYVEDKGELEQGFFKALEWEARSKNIIKECVAQLLAEEDGAPSSPAANIKSEAKNGIKRQSSEEPSPLPKRQKKATRAALSKRAKAKKEESESALSDLEDQSESEEQTKKTTKQQVAKKEESDSELSDLDSPEDEPRKAKLQNSVSRRGSKKEETESELSDLDDSDNEPKKKTKGTKKATARRKTKNITKNEEAASDPEDSTAGKKRKRAAPVKKRNTKPAKVESDNEDDLADENNEVTKDEVESVADEETVPRPGANVKTESKQEDSGENTKLNVVDVKDKDNKDVKEADADDSGSDLSSVIDDPPPKKRKAREPKGAPKPRQAKELSVDDTEIKKLQGQLLKCGIRKIWGIELKKYSDDSKAKIRHLKGMLRDIGVEGRFSEAKAKEIKEKRELMADLEAVTEMNRNWGSGAGGRASRSKITKKTSKEESNKEQDAKDEEDEDEEAKGNPRVSKRMADLAFLGSDSESG